MNVNCSNRGNPDENAVDQAAEVIGGRLGASDAVRLAVVSGSGLGILSRMGCEAGVVPFREIPGLGEGSVAGHDGLWSLLEVGGRAIYCLAGRRHLYEGIMPPVAGYAMRLLARLGVERVILTNAAGGLSPRLGIGDLMLIRDHLNGMLCNPLVGCPEEPVSHPKSATPTHPRAAVSGEVYDPSMSDQLCAAALAERIELQEGIYAALRGPCYETPAEVTMLRRAGADAVGMSTVPEALVARALGLRVAAISLITNSHVAAATPPTHDEVLEVARRSGERLKRLLARAIELGI